MNGLVFPKDKNLDFIGLGRLCIDLNANEIHRPMEETVTFTKYLGGSPANITVAMARLGMRAGFVGRVTDDQHGRYILDYLKKNGIDTSCVVTDKSGSVTGLTFTEIKSPTDCSILMYRDNVADLKLSPADVKEEYIADARVLIISGTALAKSPSREAVFLALEYARKNMTMVVFDIDYRPYSWTSKEETAIYYSLAAEKCDIILGTREEFDLMEFLTMPGNKDDLDTAGHWFSQHARIVIVKHGKAGSVAYTKEGQSYRGTTYPAKIVKTFGAGDSYAGAFLYGLMQGWDVERCLNFGAASASIVISSHSCSDAMPTVEKITKFIEACERGEPICW